MKSGHTLLCMAVFFGIFLANLDCKNKDICYYRLAIFYTVRIRMKEIAG